MAMGSKGVSSWGATAKRLVSAWLCLHLLAVFVPPFAFQASPVRGLGSPFADAWMDLLRPYIDLTYLNHGYAFFAPDPGPSHLLRVRLRYDDGREDETWLMPDLDRNWPRLLYHRYFMLSEHLNANFAPPDPPPEVAEIPEQMANWRFVRQMYVARRTAMIDYLRRRYGAAEVELERIEHELLDPVDLVEARLDPNSPEMYRVLPETMEANGPQ